MNNAETAAKQFPIDVQSHEMTIVKDDGVHRHIKFGRPGSSVYFFEIVTWPGSLCYTGDMGTFVFRRIHDMFSFFRGNEINPQYWGEKLTAADRDNGHSEFSREIFEERIKEWFGDYVVDEDMSEEDAEGLWLEIRLRVLSPADDGEYAAFHAAHFFEHKGRFPLSHINEYRCHEYTYRFAWCCLALVWAIKQYDQATASRAA